MCRHLTWNRGKINASYLKLFVRGECNHSKTANSVLAARREFKKARFLAIKSRIHGTVFPWGLTRRKKDWRILPFRALRRELFFSTRLTARNPFPRNSGETWSLANSRFPRAKEALDPPRNIRTNFSYKLLVLQTALLLWLLCTVALKMAKPAGPPASPDIRGGNSVIRIPPTLLQLPAKSQRRTPLEQLSTGASIAPLAPVTQSNGCLCLHDRLSSRDAASQ